MGIMQYITSFNGLAGRKQKKTMRHTGPPSPRTTTRGFTSRDRYTAKEKRGLDDGWYSMVHHPKRESTHQGVRGSTQERQSVV